jgi:hypothetical protein
MLVLVRNELQIRAQLDRILAGEGFFWRDAS